MKYKSKYEESELAQKVIEASKRAGEWRANGEACLISVDPSDIFSASQLAV